jgi:hypothetical protein
MCARKRLARRMVSGDVAGVRASRAHRVTGGDKRCDGTPVKTGDLLRIRDRQGSGRSGRVVARPWCGRCQVGSSPCTRGTMSRETCICGMLSRSAALTPDLGHNRPALAPVHPHGAGHARRLAPAAQAHQVFTSADKSTSGCEARRPDDASPRCRRLPADIPGCTCECFTYLNSMKTMLCSQPPPRSRTTTVLGLSFVSRGTRASQADRPVLHEVLLTSRRVVDYAQVASSLCCR